MYPDYLVRLLTDKYNCSPFHGQKKDEAVVWHFHGKKHCRDGAVELWFPVFQECMDSNFAGVSEWCPAGDKRLRKYLEDLK
jgi:hypothetical protein